jgi:tetratricopeptide (TPR) repeat protein
MIMEKLILFFLVSLLGIHSFDLFGQNKPKLKQKSTLSISSNLEDSFTGGMRLYLKSDFNEAIMVWEGLLQQVKNDPAIYYYLAKAHLELKNMASAIQNAKEANRLSPHSLDYGLFYADLLMTEGKFEDQINCLNQLLQFDEKQSDVNIRLAQAYLYQEKYEQSLKALEKINQSISDLPEVFRMKQLIYLKQKDFEKMISVGEQLLLEYPDETLFSWEFLDLVDFSKWPNAETLLTKLGDKYPTMGQIQILLAKYYLGKTQLDLTFRHISNSLKDSQMEESIIGFMTLNAFAIIKTKEDIHRASILMDQILVSFPNNSKFLSLKADISINEGKLAEAQTYYIKSTKKGANKFEQWQRIIQIDFELDKPDSAIVHAEEALTLFPNQGFLYFQLGFAQYMKGKNAQALTSLESAIPYVNEKDNWYLQLYSILGDAYQSMNRYEESDAAFDKVLALVPDEEHVLNNYSYYLSLRKSNLDKAASMAKKLVDKFPENGTYLDTYAWVLFQKKDYQNAVILLEKAVKGDKNESSVVWEHYGDALRKVNRIEEAVIAWKKAKTLPNANLILDKKIQMKQFSEN